MFGYEPVGTVAALGGGVTGFAIGQRVSGLALESLAEYVIFKAENCIPVPDAVEDEDATAEPLSCLVSAARKQRIAVPGDTVTVVGAEYMGLRMISLFRMMGAGKIITVDLRQDALRVAGEMTRIDGLLAIGAYHTGGVRSVDVQLLNVKAVAAVSTHERKDDFQIRCARKALDLLATGQWKFTELNPRIYGLNEFDRAQEELEVKPDHMIKALIDCTRW